MFVCNQLNSGGLYRYVGIESSVTVEPSMATTNLQRERRLLEARRRVNLSHQSRLCLSLAGNVSTFYPKKVLL